MLIVVNERIECRCSEKWSVYIHNQTSTLHSHWLNFYRSSRRCKTTLLLCLSSCRFTSPQWCSWWPWKRPFSSERGLRYSINKKCTTYNYKFLWTIIKICICLIIILIVKIYNYRFYLCTLKISRTQLRLGKSTFKKIYIVTDSEIIRWTIRTGLKRTNKLVRNSYMTPITRSGQVLKGLWTFGR
jgi:hypothetical protein